MNSKKIVQNYKGVVEPRKIALILAMAKKLGLPEHMFEDVVQELSLEIIGFNYDPEKSNGASEMTALAAMIEHKIIDIVRRLEFERNFLEQEAHNAVLERDELRPLQMSMDIESALNALSPTQREIWFQLADGASIKQIVKKHRGRFIKTREAVLEIRRKLTGLGLRDYLGEK